MAVEASLAGEHAEASLGRVSERQALTLHTGDRGGKLQIHICQPPILGGSVF